MYTKSAFKLVLESGFLLIALRQLNEAKQEITRYAGGGKKRLNRKTPFKEQYGCSGLLHKER